jgi:hypothetical protein
VNNRSDFTLILVIVGQSVCVHNDVVALKVGSKIQIIKRENKLKQKTFVQQTLAIKNDSQYKQWTNATKCYFLLAVLSFNVLISSTAFSAESKSMDCIAYWQLRSIGLSRNYDIASAKRSDQYNHRYQTELSLLKQDYSPKALVKGVFSAMTIMLEQIDNDYDRTTELDAGYNNFCPLKN